MRGRSVAEPGQGRRATESGGEELSHVSHEPARRLAKRYRTLEILPVCADFTQPITLPEPRHEVSRRVIFFPGSTIGNFDRREAEAVLRTMVEDCTQGDLLLIVGELDRNVDPASTMQVVDALIRADKDFELLVVPGGGHGVAESAYGTRRRRDFLVRKLWTRFGERDLAVP